MALFSHEDKQAIYNLSDMATEKREDFFKIFGKIKIFWVISPIAITILLSFVFGKIVFGIHIGVLMILGVPISFILKFILSYKIFKIQEQDKYANDKLLWYEFLEELLVSIFICKIQKQDKYDNDELLWYKFLNQLVSFFLWFMLFVFITGLFASFLKD